MSNPMKEALVWKDLFNIMYRDKQGRWYPKKDNPAAKYIELGQYRPPSYSYPKSYASALLTKKFAKWLRDNYPLMAKHYNLLQEEEISV